MSYEDIRWVELDRDRALFRILWWHWQNFGSCNNRFLSFSWWRKILTVAFRWMGNLNVLGSQWHDCIASSTLCAVKISSVFTTLVARTLGALVRLSPGTKSLTMMETKWSQCLTKEPWWYTQRVGRKAPSILLSTLAVDRRRWTASFSDYFTQVKRAFSTQWVGRWVAPRISLKMVMTKREVISCEESRSISARECWIGIN